MMPEDSEEDSNKILKRSIHRWECVAWYQHVELGFNYCMSNIIADVVHGQFPYLEGNIAQKKEIYERYKDGLKELPTVPIIDEDSIFQMVRSENEGFYM